MLEKAELGRCLTKSEYKQLVPGLRAELLEAQRRLASSRLRVILVFEGVDHVTRGTLVNQLNEWLDTRGLEFHAFGPKTDEEAQRPRFWRYWRRLPGTGRMGIFAGSWYTGTLIEQTLQESHDEPSFESHLAQIAFFERELAHDRAIILKFWLHKTSKEQKAFLKELEQQKASRIMVTDQDYEMLKAHDRLISAAETAIRHTDSAEAPWYIIEASDDRYAKVQVARTLLEQLNRRLDHDALEQQLKAGGQKRLSDQEGDTDSSSITLVSDTSILSTLDMEKHLSKEEYEKQLEKWQARLTRLSWKAHQQKRSVVIVFEGWDAAGKGGAIRRIIRAIDARICQVIQIAAPTDEEKGHHYLWRFWRHIPKAGRTTIYDRSWYGRVLVERVEGFATNSEWRRSYLEINNFEEQLSRHGIIISKFWLHITPEEQLRRFKEREETPYKQHKITEEDWRNREKWPEYEHAVQDMVVRTGTDYAPWHLIPANDKRYARVAVLKRICKDLETALDDTPAEHSEP